ncbi:MAG TPA: hypothetical protein VET45_17485 [Candidatus Binatia bacterium]|nr:hypothetical protein [Candidatus Binatia bacterium]
MTADNWSFVFAAYGLAAVVLATYWRFLVRREKELQDAGVVRQQLGQTSGLAGHPRSEPSTRSPLP